MDDLSLSIGGRKLSGWTSVRVTRGIERMPSDFDIEMTEIYPGEENVFVVHPGDPCVVKLGGDTVVTGYIERYCPSISANQHSIRVQGRGKCADLVDCSAEWPGGQIAGANVKELAEKLVQPYGVFKDKRTPIPILVQTDQTDLGARPPIQNLMLGETPFQIIERNCRWAALLPYETADGNLMLSRAGSRQAASGFKQGENVQRAYLNFSVDRRYSEVNGYIQSFDTFKEVSGRGNLVLPAVDDNITRHRRLSIIAEAGDSQGYPVLKARVAWEVARRFGRGYSLSVTADSWRDSAGKLWEPNTLVPVSLPALHAMDGLWLVTEVVYRRDEHSGTTADLVLMPPEAFLPQPVVIMPKFAEVKGVR